MGDSTIKTEVIDFTFSVVYLIILFKCEFVCSIRLCSIGILFSVKLLCVLLTTGVQI